MSLQQSGSPLPFDVTYNANDLWVGMTVTDETTPGSPVTVGSVIPMLNRVGTFRYVGFFTPIAGKKYSLSKQVYTDGTYTVLDTSGDYGEGSDSFDAQDIIGPMAQILAAVGQRVADVVAIVLDDQVIQAFVEE